jgi:uncharacterized protein YaaR (DUF327 family)
MGFDTLAATDGNIARHRSRFCFRTSLHARKTSHGQRHYARDDCYHCTLRTGIADRNPKVSLDRAISVLKKFSVAPASGSHSELTKLLDEVKHIDERKVLAIARTIQQLGTFNSLVRDNVESINIVTV